MRSKPIVTITAIPMETKIKILVFVMTPFVTVAIWFAKICKSGSAIEMKKPRAKPAMITIQTLLLLATPFPI